MLIPFFVVNKQKVLNLNQICSISDFGEKVEIKTSDGKTHFLHNELADNFRYVINIHIETFTAIMKESRSNIIKPETAIIS